MLEHAITQAKHGAKAVGDISTDDVLSALGLRRQATGFARVLPPLGYFAAGILCGAGVGLLLAPRSGRDTRRQLKSKAQNLTQRVGAAAEEMAAEVRGTLTAGTPPKEPGKETPGKEQHRPLTHS